MCYISISAWCHMIRLTITQLIPTLYVNVIQYGQSISQLQTAIYPYIHHMTVCPKKLFWTTGSNQEFGSRFCLIMFNFLWLGSKFPWPNFKSISLGSSNLSECHRLISYNPMYHNFLHPQCQIDMSHHILIALSLPYHMYSTEMMPHTQLPTMLNTLRPRQNGYHFAGDTFKCIFLNQNVRNSINISLKFVPKGGIHNITSLVQIMAWRRTGDKPLSEPMMVRLLTYICVT